MLSFKLPNLHRNTCVKTITKEDIKCLKEPWIWNNKSRQEGPSLTVNFQMFKLVLEKAEEAEIKLPTSVAS